MSHKRHSLASNLRKRKQAYDPKDEKIDVKDAHAQDLTHNSTLRTPDLNLMPVGSLTLDGSRDSTSTFVSAEPEQLPRQQHRDLEAMTTSV